MRQVTDTMEGVSPQWGCHGIPLPHRQLQSSRGHPTAELRPLAGLLTVQGVGQHAGHALHHHLVGGLQESRGGHSVQPVSGTGTPAELRDHMGNNLTSCSPHGGSVYLRRLHLSPTPQFLPPRSATGSQAGPRDGSRLSEIPYTPTAGLLPHAHPCKHNHASTRTPP